MSNQMVYDQGIAVELGLPEAIVISRIYFWQGTDSGKVVGEDRWIFNTIDQWHEQLQELTWNRVKVTLQRLERLGVLKTDRLHPNPSVRTKWYALDYEHPILQKNGYINPTLDALRCAGSKDKNTNIRKSNVASEQKQPIGGNTPFHQLKIHRSIGANVPLPSVKNASLNTVDNTRKNIKTKQQRNRDVESEFEKLPDFQKTEAMQFIKRQMRKSKNRIKYPEAYIRTMKRKILDGEAYNSDRSKFSLTTQDEIDVVIAQLG